MRKEIGKWKCKDVPSCGDCYLWRFCRVGMTDVNRTLEEVLNTDVAPYVDERQRAVVLEALRDQSCILEEDRDLATRIQKRIKEMCSDIEVYDEDFTNSTLEFFMRLEGATAKFEFNATNAFQNEKGMLTIPNPEWLIRVWIQKVPEMEDLLARKMLDMEDMEELESLIKATKENYWKLYNICAQMMKEFNLVAAID